VTISGEGVAMMTRGRKRKVGQRDSLWDLIVKCDDVCFTHSASEIEFDGFEILVRGEWRNEKVGEEILSRGRVEKEV
jgi:hypothetical protein